jgi:HSP20 family protein
MRELQQMRRDMRRLLGESAGEVVASPFRAAFLPGRAARLYPLVNVYQDGDDFRVEALAPGLDPGAVEVTAVRNTLTIRGEKLGLRDLAPEQVHRSERAAGRAAHARPRRVTVDTD